MNQKTTAVALISVPSAEIVGTVANVKKPFKMHGENIPDNAACNYFAALGVQRSITVVKAYAYIFAGALLARIILCRDALSPATTEGTSLRSSVSPSTFTR